MLMFVQKNLNSVTEPPQLWQQGQEELALNAWHYLQSAIKPLTFRWSPPGQDLGIGVMCQSESHPLTFLGSSSLFYHAGKFFLVVLNSLLKKCNLLCPCVNRLYWNSEHVSALTLQSSAGWFLHLFGKGFFPPGLIKSKASSTELPGWGFTQGEVSLHFFPAHFS